jgi:ribosomal protein S27E
MSDESPRYGVSVSYTPCPECGEGTMEYDEAADESRCTVCGAVVD